MRLLGRFETFVSAKQHEIFAMFADTPSARLCDMVILRSYTTLTERVPSFRLRTALLYVSERIES